MKKDGDSNHRDRKPQRKKEKRSLFSVVSYLCGEILFFLARSASVLSVCSVLKNLSFAPGLWFPVAKICEMAYFQGDMAIERIGGMPPIQPSGSSPEVIVAAKKLQTSLGHFIQTLKSLSPDAARNDANLAQIRDQV